MDITLIPTDESKKDLQDSRCDAAVCEDALHLNITTYSNGSVQERLDDNKHFIEVITKELARRGES